MTTDDAPVPDLSVAEQLRGQAVALVLVGSVGTVIQLVLAPTWWITAAALATGLAVGLLAVWLLARLGVLERRLDRVAVGSGEPARPGRAARRSGVMVGLAGVAGGIAVIALESLLLGAQVWNVVAPVLIGLGINARSQVGQVQRWEQRHGNRVFTRVGAPVFAWTARQSTARLVVVPATPRPQQTGT